MRALTIIPGRPDSVRLVDVPEPGAGDGSVLVRTMAIGICGTDHELVDGAYGSSPEGAERLVIGHESLGIVEGAPEDSGFGPGDWIVGIVRRPDPVPCPSCAIGEWDMCKNGLYTERGIKGRDGFGAERFRIEPDFAVKVPTSAGRSMVLLEPASVVAKAWDHIARIGNRALWTPRTVLVTGAGPVGLLAALLGIQRGLEVHVLDRVVDGPKPRLVGDLGARYHTGSVSALDFAPDIVIECTGASEIILDVVNATAAAGIVCLAGVSSGSRSISLDLGSLNRSMVLENDVIFGSVNANRLHYERAAEALSSAPAAWLARLITREVPLDRWQEAFVRRPDDVKVVLDFGG